MKETSLALKKLDGKVAMVTGGASGIGEATARLFANLGARAVVIADIQDESGRQVAESIGLDCCSYVHCDVTDEEQVKSTVECTVQKYGQLDIMFSNAGVMSHLRQTVLDLDLSELDATFATNVRGMAACVKYAARAMFKGSVRGSIICTASGVASQGWDSMTDYIMSKSAILGLVRLAAKQLGAHGIRVNSVSPYAVATPMSCKAAGVEAAEELEKLYQPYMILKGPVMKVNNVADAVLFLASDDSAFITGHDLHVGGGFSVT